MTNKILKTINIAGVNVDLIHISDERISGRWALPNGDVIIEGIGGNNVTEDSFIDACSVTIKRRLDRYWG